MLLLHKHIQLFVFLVKEFIQAIEDLGKPSAALKKLRFSPDDSGKARGQHLPRQFAGNYQMSKICWHTDDTAYMTESLK